MRVFKSFAFWNQLFSLLMIVTAGILGWQLYTLDVLPGNIQIPVLTCLGLVCLIVILVKFEFSLSPKIMVGAFAVSVILTAVFGTGSYYLYRTSGTLSAITAVKKTSNNKVSLIVPVDSSIETPEDIAGKRVGVLKNIDKGGTEQALTQLEKRTDAQYELVELDSVPQEVLSLYTGEVDAIVLNEAYRTNVMELEGYEDFSDRTRVLFQASFKTDATNEALAVSDVTTRPYNILISGNDTYGDVGELSRSDVNMIVTINPVTSTVLLTSIPRDSYVPVDCGDAYACAQGQLDKITHTGINGITSTKQTLEQLLDIDINYTFRVNFSSVTNIVDSLGGIDIEVPEGQAVETFYADSTLEGVTEGRNHLDGERALAFARERYAYIDGDNQRVRNQQMVLKAIFDKATSPEIIVNYPNLLQALESAFDTTLTQDEITNFIKYQIQARPGWKFESYQLSGEDAMLFCPSLGQEAYVTVPDPNTTALAHDKIMAVLDGKDADTVTEPQSAAQQDEIHQETVSVDDVYDGQGYYGVDSGYYDPSQWSQPEQAYSEEYPD
ncbi:LCP family protein [Faecalibaculum rodentium]|jgi:LCP family protein required for cell wall assembly|uniref:LCP family protein n=5 Tax=Faecalibaculum rodentium TaxID=1702221 RepID=UPI0026272D87|nr:LCP family protein [Faecalibaculum rodentium]